MFMQPINTPRDPVAVEYDKMQRGKIIRARKIFACMYEARRFYTAKFKENRNPAVKKVVD
jgi:hypothetical protein